MNKIADTQSIVQGAKSPTPPSQSEVSVSRLRETSNILKDLKPPVYNGEEKERNKDAINTFLQKWQDFHRLRNTPPENQVVEASLSLGNKAYKWWMSLREANKIPRYWPEFEQAFLKEFLPENELERAWEAWDKCNMGKNTLNQYISNYREAVLKLKGIDEF